MALGTLPWVEEVLKNVCSEWDLSHGIARVLRGNNCSPGFVEDWKFQGAMTQRDVEKLTESITSCGTVCLALLCSPCRHYVGPELTD